MNIKLRNIPKFLWGGNLWFQQPYYWNNLQTVFFNNLPQFDPKDYKPEYDTSKLVNGDMSDTYLTPWKSDIQGYDLGRYQPTTGYGIYGKNKNHYNYTQNIENNPYYKTFGEALIDNDGNFTPIGKAWALAVDTLLPYGSKASFFDENGNIRKLWTVKDNDIHGRAPKTFNNLKDYVNYVRNDLILGARHNVFLLKGTRYFYTDKEGNRHWVNPEDAKKYELSSEPVELGWEGNVYWNDYELLGPKNDPPSNTSSVKKENGSRVNPDRKEKYSFDWSKIQSVASKILNNPNLYAAGRLAGNLISNERVYDEYIKGIRPNLLQTYQTHRQVLGDEATKQAYYRRAAQGQTKAAQPFTSDADRQVAYMNEAKRVGDELRALGDLADNQEIRRTSDESNQHQWANTQRATEVANTNLASINKALADKHSILAQKHAANWSSIDNFLLGLETRNNQKIAERKAIQNLIDALEQYDWLNNNKNYQDALKAYNDYVAKNGDNFSTDIKLQELSKDVVNAKRNALKGWLNLRLISAKEGAKITYKKKDDLLYKTAKDTVDHFREMSKLLKRKRKDKQEIVKLAPHPKGSTRRYLLGGVAPFTVYKPAPLGGETTISSQGSTSSTKADKVDPKKESLDMIKQLFTAVSASGIPIDASLIYKDMNNFLAKSRLFGDELSTDDIASMYVNMMYKVNNLKFSEGVYNKARESAVQNEALNDYAVDASGNVVVLDKESKGIKLVELSEFLENRDKYTPLTNNMLLQMRAYNPEMAFLAGDNFMNNIVANGVGITKISEYIKNLIGTLGTNEEKIEGLSKIESGKVKEGIKIIDNLINAAPDGVYKLSLLDKTQKSLVEAAFRYVMGSLPILQKAILQLHASEVGMDLKDLLLNRLTSNTGYTHNIEIDPLTGRAAKDANGNSKEGSGSELKLDAATALISGKGYQGVIEFNPGTSYAVTVNARYSGFLKKSGENMGSGITMQEATTSTLDKVLDWNKATLGGSRLNPTGYNRIIINNDDVVGVDLPVGSDKNTPDFTMLLKLQVLDLELLKRNIEDDSNNWKLINQICLELGLPAKYKNDGTLNEHSWNRFAAFQVTTDDSVLVNKDIILNDILKMVEDNNVKEQYELIILKNNKNYKLGRGFLGLSKQALYLGTVFVPIKSNYVASALSGGLNISMLEATNLELRERGYDLLKIKTYKPGLNINNL